MSGHWTQRPEGGSRLALWLICTIGLHGGRRLARLLLLPITLYFLLMRGPERRASRAYLSRVFGRPARWTEVARHVHCFASTILDRLFLLSGRDRALDIRTHGLDALHAAMEQGRGVLLFGSHHGSFEALRALSATRPDVRVRVVFDKGQSPALTCLFDRLNPDIARTAIDARQPGTAIVLAIGEAAASGALVGLLADRGRPGEATRAAPFLGSPAPFPVAPALIAATLKVPAVLCFGLYRGGNRYDLHFEHFADALDIPRRERAAALDRVLARYAQRLEHYVRLAPYNWFNFYDFWQNDGDVPAASAASAPADGTDGRRDLDARRA